MNEVKTTLEVTESGQQTIMTGPPSATLGVISTNDPVIATHILAVSDDERAEIIELSETNDIPDGTIKAKAINI